MSSSPRVTTQNDSSALHPADNLYPFEHQAASSTAPPEFNALPIFAPPASTPADRSSDHAAIANTPHIIVPSSPRARRDSDIDVDSQSDSLTVSLSEDSDFEQMENVATASGRQTDPQVCALRNRFWLAKRQIKERQRKGA